MRDHRNSGGMVVRLLVFFSAVFLPSCVTIKNPLMPPDQSKPDERLFGAWKEVPREADGTTPSYLFIGKSGHDTAPVGLMKAVLIDMKENRNVRVDTLYFFRATLEGVDYVHVVDNATSSPAGHLQWEWKASTYTLLKYAVDKDRIEFWLMDGDAAEAAITKGQLKGTVTRKGPLKLRTVEITETGEGLARSLKGEGGKLLFPDAHKVSFVRMK